MKFSLVCMFTLFQLNLKYFQQRHDFVDKGAHFDGFDVYSSIGAKEMCYFSAPEIFNLNTEALEAAKYQCLRSLPANC